MVRSAVEVLIAFSMILPVVSATTNNTCNVLGHDRLDCHIGQEQDCVAKGCCWKPVSPNPDNFPWCFQKGVHPAPGPSPGPAPGPPGPLPGCEVFNANQCQGNVIETDPGFEANRWFTPVRGDPDYQPSFQDYGRLVAYAHVTYSDATLSSATVSVQAVHKDPSAIITCILGGKELPCKANYSKEQSGPLSVLVKGSDGTSIHLEDIDFHWNAPPVKARDGDYRGGQKGAIVELFGWPHSDIENECKSLASMGYLGVKVFPIHEQVMSSEPFNNMMNPWYFMYQPVSYRMQGRMGTRDELRSMIATCRSFGVRVYADAVINHMSGGGNDANTHHRNPQAGCTTWGNKTSSLSGGHSPYYTQNFVYTIGNHTGKQPLQEFPGVPYGPLDFHCDRPLNSWTDPLDLNAGWLTGLTDLNTERESVQERIAAYLTDMIGIGFSGFRIDAAKHIKPDDLVGILSKFKRNVGGALPSDFFTWLEVLLGGEADLLMCNPNSGYNFGSYLTGQLSNAGFTKVEIQQIKTWNSGYPKEAEKGVDDCNIDKSGLQRQVIMNDDHDQQNPGSSSRDMGDAGCVLIKGCDEAEHRRFEVELFTSPPGAKDNNNDYPIRNILSSFYWAEGEVQGMPDGKSDCSLCTINCGSCKTMPYEKAFDPTSKGYDTGKGKYTRVHRDPAIVNAMRSWMGLKDASIEEHNSLKQVIV